MRYGSVFALLALLVPVGLAEEPAGMPADKALALLREGNQRYMAHRETHPDATPERRHDLSKGQNPYAIILGCADSRVPPELIFDAGLGDLFVIREAGNVVDTVVIGSVEYAVEHLGTKLIVVLGHEQCGAVTAAVKHSKDAHITSIVKLINPAVNASAKQPGDPVQNCVVANAKQSARILSESNPILAKAIASGGLKVVAAEYRLETGKVEILD
jgi:carbonic anhydrase